MDFSLDLGSAISSVVSGILGKQTNDQNLQIWREQKEWNRPINQLARLQEAGMNPNLIYGNGGVQNTISAVPKLESPHVNLGLMIARRQLEKSDSEKDLLDAQKQKILNGIKNSNARLLLDQTNSVQRQSLMAARVCLAQLAKEFKSYELDYWKKHQTARGAGVLQLIDFAKQFIEENEMMNPMFWVMRGLGSSVGQFEKLTDKFERGSVAFSDGIENYQYPGGYYGYSGY